MKKDYEGSCHCGDVEFRTTLDLDECLVCDCSICNSKGTIINRVEKDNFELSTPIENLTLYQFNKMIAKHYFCPTCGIHPFHRPRSFPDMWAVNVRCLNGVDITTIEPRQAFGSQLD